MNTAKPSRETPRARRAGQRGVTLIELMVALVLGLLLTAGAVQVFIGNRATFSFNEGLSRLQENGRFALDTLAHRTRMAGYMGCLSDITVYNNLNDSASLAFDFGTGLAGFEAIGTAPGDSVSTAAPNPSNSGSATDWSPSLAADIVGNAIPTSDVLVIRNVSSSSHALVSPYNDSAQAFVDAEPDDYNEGELGIVSDCQKASVFQITSIDNGTSANRINVNHSNASFTPGNAEPTWSDDEEYGEGAELLRAETWVYYVGARAAGEPPVLYQQRLRLDQATDTVELVADELVEGVDTMQVLYGIDAGLDGAVDDYVTADSVADWDDVVAVRVALLMRSPDEYGTEVDEADYDVNELTFDPADDRRVRQAFTTTIALRNRLP